MRVRWRQHRRRISTSGRALAKRVWRARPARGRWALVRAFEARARGLPAPSPRPCAARAGGSGAGGSGRACAPGSPCAARQSAARRARERGRRGDERRERRERREPNGLEAGGARAARGARARRAHQNWIAFPARCSTESGARPLSAPASLLSTWYCARETPPLAGRCRAQPGHVDCWRRGSFSCSMQKQWLHAVTMYGACATGTHAAVLMALTFTGIWRVRRGVWCGSPAAPSSTCCT